MTRALFAFSMGIIIFFLPYVVIFCLLAGFIIFICIFRLEQKFYLCCIVFLFTWIGYAWVNSQAEQRASFKINNYYNKKIIITGIIHSIPRNQYHHLRFDVDTLTIADTPCKVKIRLNWYGRHPYLFAGSIWHLQVKLKLPINYTNKNGFNYARYLKTENIVATGYVMQSPLNYQLKSSFQHTTINTLRQRVALKIKHAVKNYSLSGILTALTIGSRYLLTKKEWKIFQATGTSHLVAVSGLHVGLVASFFFFLTSWLWRRSSVLCILFPAQKVATLGALSAGIFYAVMAGLSIPTLRALAMLTVLLLASITFRNVPIWYRLLCAFVCVLALQPFAILSVSFWLSFMATAILGFCLCARLKYQRGIIAWIKIQVLISIGLIPFVLLFFQRLSLITVFTNLIAIPYVSFVVLPLCLVALAGYYLCNGIDDLLWILCAKALSPLWWYLSACSQLSFSVWQHEITSPWIFMYALLAVGLCLAPTGFPARILAIVFGLTLIFA